MCGSGEMDVEKIRRIKEEVEGELLKRPGVTGVDVNYKVVGGHKTDRLAIRIYVKKKRDVPKREAIPETISGVMTDVIERRFVLKNQTDRKIKKGGRT